MPAKRGIDILQSVSAIASVGPVSGLRERMRDQAIALVRTEDLADIGYSYRILVLDAPVGETLTLAGETLYAPWLVPSSGELTGLACAVCSIGARLEARVSSLFKEKRASLALALDALGNEMLFAVSRLVQDRMLSDVRRQNLSMCGELRPGDPGMSLDAHAAVLRLAQAQAINVGLRGNHTLLPLKSMSIVMGVGIDLPVAAWSRCDHCPSRARCKLVTRTAEIKAL